MAIALCILNWLIPGAGFAACRDYARGAALFVLINTIFAIGVLLGGYVLAPDSLVPMTRGFNLVGALTYLAEAFHGGGWVLIRFLQNVSADNPDAFFQMKNQAIKTYSDLGVFHLVVAGGLNYFATVRLYDLLAGNPELTEGEAAPPKDSGGEERDSAGGERISR